MENLTKEQKIKALEKLLAELKSEPENIPLSADKEIVKAEELLWSGKQTKCNWNDAKTFAENLNKQNYLDRNNWRLPTRSELVRAHENGIKGFETDYYWSSSTYVSNTAYAWIVYFSNGIDSYYYKDNGSHVRCVSPEPV